MTKARTRTPKRNAIVATNETRAAGGRAKAEKRERDYVEAAEYIATLEDVLGATYPSWHPVRWDDALRAINFDLPPGRHFSQTGMVKFFAGHPDVIEQARRMVAESIATPKDDTPIDPGLRKRIEAEWRRCGVGENETDALLNDIRRAFKDAMTRYGKRLEASLILSASDRNKAWQYAIHFDLPKIRDQYIDRIIDEELPKWAREVWVSELGRFKKRI